ncbi:MAG TPA: DEAD/DEAH box helicase [Oligoflexia bacterium]|nr:DEAD/DEAH box helicase [Oligoflexia bacterium]
MFALRTYQQEAVDATLHHFRRSRLPAVIVLPTGAGKSLVIAELARLARGRVLILAHVKELVDQNYSKFKGYGLQAGIYSAGLNRRDDAEKVIFGGIQSVARADESFFRDFSLLVIDECHRVSLDGDTQYAEVIKKIRHANPEICILGLTATPYRTDTGWIYRFNHRGYLRTTAPRIFEHCIYELTLQEMISAGYLISPVQIDAPVASYDFSTLELPPGSSSFRLEEIEALLKQQSRITPVIVRNIVELAEHRRGALLFAASVAHAQEILRYLPPQASGLIVGDTPGQERDCLIERFKAQQIKYLVNVSVLTTGFDAPHVDLIAILRPTESVTLYQQIVGRGLRLHEGKADCLVLDYTGVPHDIFQPEIQEPRPIPAAEPVQVACPECSYVNDFWGIRDERGDVVEHFGKKCAGAVLDPVTGDILPCGFRYRFCLCEACGAENELGAECCVSCLSKIVDDTVKLREALQSSETHVMRPDTMAFSQKTDKKGVERLEVRYYDLDGQHLSEVFFFDAPGADKVFFYNFSRMHNRTPERRLHIQSPAQAMENRERFRQPLFVIARKQGRFWKIREKIFL